MKIRSAAVGLLCLPAASTFANVTLNPSVTTAATPFNASFAAANLFDGTPNEYASQGLGAATFVNMDFGTAVTMDRFVVITRANNVDVVGQSRLTLSNDPNFASGNSVFNFNPSGQNGQGLIQSFTSTTARYARWEVVTSTGTSQNLGGSELRFLNTPAGSSIAPAVAYNSATPFSPQFATANAANGDAGRGAQAGIEYASASLGANMFVDFDLGSVKLVTGFDFFDRIPAVDRTTAFDLIFDDDSSTFASPVGTLSFTPGATGWGFSQNFSAINARYVRLDATGTASAINNSGVQEMIFYAVPEPSAALLAGLAGLLPALRRRRA